MKISTKNLSKILTFVVIVVLIATICGTVFAAPTDPSTLTGTSTTSFDSWGQKIIGLIQALGSITAVAILVVLGIKYMMGSAEEKAEYKKTMIPYIVGAILVFAAANLASMIYGFASTVTN